MKPIDQPQTSHPDDNDLDEEVLENAAREDGKNLAPEESSETEELTAWDETPDASGHQIPDRSEESDETIAEQLVDAGNDEADREQRKAADDLG